MAGQEEPHWGPGPRVLPGPERRGRISSHVSAMLILFIHRRVMLHPPGVTPLIHVRLMNCPHPQIRSSARVWREKRMGPVGLSIPWADGRAGESGAGGCGSGLPGAPCQRWAPFHGEIREPSAAGRDGERVTPRRPPPLARSGAAG